MSDELPRTRHLTTARYANALTLMLIISKFQLMFLMEVCVDPVNYSMFYVSAWSCLSVNSRLIFTPLSSMD